MAKIEKVETRNEVNLTSGKYLVFERPKASGPQAQHNGDLILDKTDHDASCHLVSVYAGATSNGGSGGEHEESD